MGLRRRSAHDRHRTDLHTLRVFLGPDGGGGNPLGVVLDGAALRRGERQAFAAELGYLRDRVRRSIARPASCGSTRRRSSCRSPGIRSVGTAWLLAQTGHAGRHAAPAGRRGPDVERGRPDVDPRPAGVERRPTTSRGSTRWRTSTRSRSPAATRWSPHGRGRTRPRAACARECPERDRHRARSEATGAAALQFGALLGRDLVIRQGEGSELHVRPADDGTVAVGGRVAYL